ncbi:MAG: NUDIX domain-containing protein, partial [Planktomarina sp.]|nr:NUDIX domain-containing protein [Planktomarina sp.]
MQRFDASPNPIRKYIPRPSVYAILPMKGGVLATFQAGIHNEYQLPGGGIDLGEQPIQALHREVLEETGWRINRPLLFFRF